MINEAKKVDKVAVSMENVTVGRQVNEGDILNSVISNEDKKILKEIFKYINNII